MYANTKVWDLKNGDTGFPSCVRQAAFAGMTGKGVIEIPCCKVYSRVCNNFGLDPRQKTLCVSASLVGMTNLKRY